MGKKWTMIQLRSIEYAQKKQQLAKWVLLLAEWIVYDEIDWSSTESRK